MQALQKAAKEREGTTHSPDKGAPMVGDLGLEPLEVVAPTKAGSAKLALDTSETPSPAQASAILQATQSQRSMIGWLRDHRTVVYAALVGSVLLGYGVYFYVSVYHPALLRRPFAHQAAATTALTPPLPPVVPPQREIPTVAEPENSLSAAQGTATPQATAPSRNDSAHSGARREREASSDLLPSRQSNAQTELQPRQPRNSIAVTPGGESPKPNQQLTDAYDALRSGHVEDAKSRYDALLLTDPHNIDALLGRATIAQQLGDLDAATRYFYQVLQLEPTNTMAQGGLINFLGRADPQSAESRLKSLISKDPSAFLYFALGNLHADQGNWPAAQSAYFQAHHLQPENADYVFNLAVSLEHLSQPKLALGFYRQALELAKVSGSVNFDSAAAQERTARLAASVD